MRAKPTGAQITSLTGADTPLGRLVFGGSLPDSQGTGLRAFRSYDMYAIVILRSGSGLYEDAAGFRRRLIAGDLITVFPDLPHRYGPESGDRWSEAFLSFRGAAFDHWRSFGLDPAMPVWHVGSPERNARRLLSFLERNMGDLSDACRALGEFHALLASWISLKPAVKKTPPWLEASRYSLMRTTSAPDMDQIARQAGMSPDGFRRSFRNATGETPAAFHRRHRLACAKELLRRRELTLNQVAEALGFCDAFHLSKCFKQHFGKSPQRYRLELADASAPG